MLPRPIAFRKGITIGLRLIAIVWVVILILPNHTGVKSIAKHVPLGLIVLQIGTLALGGQELDDVRAGGVGRHRRPVDVVGLHGGKARDALGVGHAFQKGRVAPLLLVAAGLEAPSLFGGVIGGKLRWKEGKSTPIALWRRDTVPSGNSEAAG